MKYSTNIKNYFNTHKHTGIHSRVSLVMNVLLYVFISSGNLLRTIQAPCICSQNLWTSDKSFLAKAKTFHIDFLWYRVTVRRNRYAVVYNFPYVFTRVIQSLALIRGSRKENSQI